MDVSSNGVATEEPCCPKCGYALVGLPEFRCPECGTPFDPEYLQDAAARTHLLQWERPEIGRRLRRLSRTILHASLHPGRFFAAVGRRKDRRIARAGSLVVACAIASVCFHAAAILLDRIAFFLRLTWRHGAPQKALETTVKVVQMTALSEWFMPTLQVLSMLLSIFVIAVFLARVFRRRSGALRDMDFAAALSPAIALGALIAASTQVILTISGPYGLGELIAVAVWGQVVVLLLLVWHCCRKLLALGRAKTVAAVVVCGLLQYGAACVVSFILTQLLLLILL